jgi:hypothetical protein
MSSNAYVYSPLAKCQIRLLELQPFLADNFNEKEMSGIVLILSLAEATALGYQALSYTWGPPKLTEKLKIERKTAKQYLHHRRAPFRLVATPAPERFQTAMD